jgi:hypothetical protein
VALVVAVPTVAVSLAAAGCGGSPSPGVAAVSSPAATRSTTEGGSGFAAPPQGSAASGAHAQFRVAMRVGDLADGARFSACMRTHGEPSFPDPNGQGVIQFGSSDGIDPGSSTFQKARSACQKLLPNGGRPTPQQQAQQQQQLLAFSACMRAHGIKDFPDPSNGGLTIRVDPSSDLDPSNPLFQQAQKACRALAPGAKGAPGPAGAGPKG